MYLIFTLLMWTLAHQLKMINSQNVNLKSSGNHSKKFCIDIRGFLENNEQDGYRLCHVQRGSEGKKTVIILLQLVGSKERPDL